MAIFLYKRTGTKDGLEVFVRDRNIAFGGNKHGIVYNFLKARDILSRTPAKPNYAEQSGGQPYILWSSDINNMLKSTGRDPEQVRVLIDLKPKVQNNVSLYEILKVWGVTHPNWTPLMLQLRPLFIDTKVTAKSPETCKKQILVDPNANLDPPVFDFIYLRGGYEEGPWSPAQLGFHSGVLWWPEAARFFTAELQSHLKEWRPHPKAPKHKLLC